jgi:hypothetical protein
MEGANQVENKKMIVAAMEFVQRNKEHNVTQHKSQHSSQVAHRNYRMLQQHLSRKNINHNKLDQ